MFDKGNKAKMIGIHIVIYKIVAVHITFCSDPFRHGNGIHGIGISRESHNLASLYLHSGMFVLL